MRIQRRRLFILMLLSFAALMVRAHAHAATTPPSFADVLERFEDGKSAAVHDAFLAMVPKLTDRQRKQIQKAVRLQEHQNSYDFSLLYTAGLAEESDIEQLTILFCGDFVQAGYLMGEEMLDDLFPSHSMDIPGLEHINIKRDVIQSMHEKYLAHDKTIVKAINKAQSDIQKMTLPETNRHLSELFFEKLTQTGFRHYQDKCDERLN